MLEETTTTSRT